MSTQEIDKAKLGRLIEKAGQCYEMSRLMEQDAEGYLAEVQRLMDYAGLDRIETAAFVAARAKKGTKIRLEKKP